MNMIKSFPLLVLSLLFYVGMGYVTDVAYPWYYVEAFSMVLTSGDRWQASCGDLFLMITLVLLSVELVRSTQSDQRSLLNHALDVLVFIAALTLFILHPGYGNSTFFGLLAMTLIDFVAGFIISIASARRDVSVGHSPHHSL